MSTVEVLNRPGLVPAHRLADALVEAREQAGRSVADLAADLPELSEADLIAFEAGQRAYDDQLVARVAEAYGLATGRLLPGRAELTIDVNARTLAIGSDEASVPRWRRGPDQMLIRYLGLVYALRGIEPGQPIPIRDADVSVLASAFQFADIEVDARLRALQRDPDHIVTARSALLKRRVVVPAAGLLVGLTAAGALIMVGSSAAPQEVELGSGTSITRSVDGFVEPADLGPATSIVRADLAVDVGSGASLQNPDPTEVEIGEGRSLTRPAFD